MPKDEDTIRHGDLVHLHDRPHAYEVTGVNHSPHGNSYLLKGGSIWYRETELRRAPEREVAR